MNLWFLDQSNPFHLFYHQSESSKPPNWSISSCLFSHQTGHHNINLLKYHSVTSHLQWIPIRTLKFVSLNPGSKIPLTYITHDSNDPTLYLCSYLSFILFKDQYLPSQTSETYSYFKIQLRCHPGLYEDPSLILLGIFPSSSKFLCLIYPPYTNLMDE